MKNKITILSSLTLVAFCTSAFIVKYSSGIAGETGSPGETSCSSCHYGGTGVTSASVSATPAFTGNQYTPGQTYTVNINLSSTTLSHFGFGCEILNGTTSSATNSGTISAISGSSKILTSGSRKNAVHISTAAGTGSPSTKTFSFKWVAPASGTAAIYLAGLAVNNNGNDGSGDLVKTTSLILSPTVATGVDNVQTEIARFNVYPNPTAETITMDYLLLQEGPVKASLYNLQGKEVALLFNEPQTIGAYNKSCTLGKDLSPGVYIVKLLIENKVLQQKMIIKQ